MNVAQSITGWLRATGYYRIPESLAGGRLEITESIKLPDHCLLEGDGRGSRIHCLGSFPAFVFLNLNGSASVGAKIRSVRETRDGDADAGGAAYVISTTTLQGTDLWLQTAAIAATYGDAGDPLPLTVGGPVALGGFGADMLVMSNIDGAEPDGDGTRCAFKLLQRYDTSSGPDEFGRQNVQLHLCYNINKSTGGRDVLTEPAVSWTIESHVQGEDPDADYVEAGLIFWGTDGSQQRPFYVTARADNAEGGIGFKSAHYHFTSGRDDATEDDTILHVTAGVGNGAQVGVGVQCDPNVNFHVIGKVLQQSPSALADEARWLVHNGAGGTYVFAAANDAQSDSNPVWIYYRSGYVPTRAELYATLSLPEVGIHNDNAAAVAAGLAVGDIYSTATGEVRRRV